MSFSSAFSVLSKKRPFLTVSFLVGALLTLNACSSAPRGLAHKVSRPFAEVGYVTQEAPIAAFATAVAALPVGSSERFALSPLGNDVWVTGGEFYVSALGDDCRKAEVTTGSQRLLFTVCHVADGTWRYITPLELAVRDGE